MDDRWDMVLSGILAGVFAFVLGKSSYGYDEDWGAVRNPRRYIFPERKRFPVYDVEHERRALAYVKAGRIAEKDIPAVLRYLREEARDPGVRRGARERGLADRARRVIRERG
jgi:hypothetical protein